MIFLSNVCQTAILQKLSERAANRKNQRIKVIRSVRSSNSFAGRVVFSRSVSDGWAWERATLPFLCAGGRKTRKRNNGCRTDVYRISKGGGANGGAGIDRAGMILSINTGIFRLVSLSCLTCLWADFCPDWGAELWAGGN